MDTITFILQSLNQVHERLIKTLDGLTVEQVVWRPVPHANCILEILWHLARSDDRMSTEATGRETEILRTGRWYERLGRPRVTAPGDSYQFLREETGFHPPLEHLIDYLRAVQTDTVARLGKLSPEDLDAVPDPSRQGRTRAAMFRHMITHRNNHHGQVDFIRGLQEPAWDLPPGTGIVQP